MVQPTFQDIFVIVEDKVATIKINRPKALNSLLMTTYKELGKALHYIDTLPDVILTVITGKEALYLSALTLFAKLICRL